MAETTADVVDILSSVTYTDKPLRPNECRLLKLHETCTGDDIRVSLTVCSLDFDRRDSRYYALSYTWGHPYGESEDGTELTSTGKSPIIVCDGIPLKVKRNLFEALLQLAARRYFVDLWIDAICIDQSDDSERTKQIQLMADIYSKAKEVIIWLGCGDDESKEAIPIIEKFGRQLLLAQGPHIPFNDRTYLESHGLYPLSETQWKAILIFFRRRWFRRVWTLQEASLALNTRAICGSEEFDLSCALSFANFAIKSGWMQDLYAMGEHLPFGRNNGFGEAASLLEWIGSNWPGKGLGMLTFIPITSSGEFREPTPEEIWLRTIDRLIRCTRIREVTKPADKILAPLSLAVKFLWGVKPEMKTELIKLMDCRSTPQQLFTAFTTFMITASDDLAILSQVNGDALSDLANLPSWIPDYNTKGMGYLMERRNFNATDFLYKGDRPHHEARVFPSSALLRVKAILCCRIDEIALAWTEPCVIDSWCRIVQKPLWPYPTSRTEILWRTLITDRYNLSDPATHDAQNSFCQFIAYTMATKYIHAERESHINHESVWPSHIWYDHLARREGILPSREAISIVKQQLNKLLETASKSGTVQPGARPALTMDTMAMNADLIRCEYHTEFNRTGNNLCVSDRGYTGLVSDQAKPGDFICFIQGARVPFILRRSLGNRYRLIGECYLHGLMRGELARLELAVEDILLE